MGQEILSPEVLIHKPVDVIVITTQWRARDITLEIQDRGIKSDEILVLLNQELRPYDGSPILE
ncbi:hypothetical protein HOF92_14025 [bacterium]|nr:hypothetical protein [bacterium]